MKSATSRTAREAPRPGNVAATKIELTPDGLREIESAQVEAQGARDSLDHRQVLGRLQGVEAEVEHTALVSVKVDLERSDVVSVDLRGSRDEDEPAADVNVSLDGETEQPEELFERAQSTRRGGSSLRTPRLVGIGLDATPMSCSPWTK